MPVRAFQACCPYRAPLNDLKDGSAVRKNLLGAGRPPSCQATFTTTGVLVEQPRCSRRSLGLTASAAILYQLLRPLTAGAAPFPANIFDNFLSSQPEPILFPRKALDQIFAVLLMRSAYDAVDELNFIPMDRFQSQFWKLRQAEYEPYILQRSPLRVRQGDLTDPAYFDFISFAQLATVSQEIPSGRQLFEEYCEDCQDSKKLVQRDAALQSNALLPAAFERSTGDKIYEGLRNGFRGRQFDAPAPSPSGTPLQELVGSVQRIVHVFVNNGYALRGAVLDVKPSRSCASTEWHGACPSAGTFRIRLEGPATLWGTAALEQRRALNNAYDAMTIEAYLRSSGCSASYSVQHNDTTIEEFWTVA